MQSKWHGFVSFILYFWGAEFGGIVRIHGLNKRGRGELFYESFSQRLGLE